MTERAPRSDKGKPRPDAAKRLAELTMYVDVSIDVLQAMKETSGTDSTKNIDTQLATLNAVKARIGPKATGAKP